MNALVDFDKPLIAAVRGAAIGGGTTMLLHCDFVYAGESTRFQMPFINLALVPEFGSSCLVPLTIGHIRAAELILLGAPFDARRAAELGLVTQVVPDREPPTGGDRNRAESGSETGWCAASVQTASEAFLSRTDQGGYEGRERGIQRARSL